MLGFRRSFLHMPCMAIRSIGVEVCSTLILHLKFLQTQQIACALQQESTPYRNSEH